MKTNFKAFAYVFVAIMLTTLLMAVSPAFANQSEDKEVEIEANPDITTWIPDQKVNPTIENEKNPSIATDGNGVLWVAHDGYYQPTSSYGIWVASSSDGGVTWISRGGIVNTGFNRINPSIAIDPYYNYVYVVYEYAASSTNHDIRMLWFNGTHWDYVSIDNSANDDRSPQIVWEYDWGSTNYGFIVYERTAGSDTDILFTRSTNHGNSWSTPIEIYDTPSRETDASIAYGGNDNVYVAFAETQGTPTNISLARSINAGYNWIVENNIDSITADNCYNPSVIATHPDDYLVMVAFESLSSTTFWDVRYVCSTDRGDNWGGDYIIAATTWSETYPHLTVDGMGLTRDYVGDVHVAYRSSAGGPSGSASIVYRKTNVADPYLWSSAVRVSDDDAYVSGSYPNYADRAITTVHTNVPVVVWTDYRSDYDVYATTLGGKYTIDTYPSGLRVSIDGLYYDAPQTRYWPLKTTHSLATYNQASHTLIGWSTGQTTSTISFVAEQTSTEPIIAYFTPSLTLNLSPTPIARGSVLTISGQLIPGSATTVTLYYRTTGVTWAVATYLPTNAAGAYNVGATVPFSLPTGTYDLVAVWWDATTNRYAVSGIKQLIIT